jgi:hypothetical protein
MLANSSLLNQIPAIVPASTADDLLNLILKTRSPQVEQKQKYNKFNYVIKHEGK